MKTCKTLFSLFFLLSVVNSYGQEYSINEYKNAGDNAYNVFVGEQSKQMAELIDTSNKADEQKMYESLYEMYQNYLYIIQEGGNIVPYMLYQEIASRLKEGYTHFVNGGIYYYDKGDFKKAADYFLAHWNIPGLWIFQKDEFVLDVTAQTIKYYAVVSSLQSDDSKRTISLLNRLISEPYIQNDAYDENHPYELLAVEYQKIGDRDNYMRTLNYGMRKFKNNKFFMPTLINEYIMKNDLDGAIILLDESLKENVVSFCEVMGVKGSVYVQEKDMKKAEKAYKDALQNDPYCERALEGLGVLYILIAQDLKDAAEMAKSRKEQSEIDSETIVNYQKSLELLLKYRNVLEKRNAEKGDLISAFMKLQNVYYNLSLLNVDFSEELDKITTEIDKLRDE